MARDQPDSFMPLNIGLYLADTGHLSVAEHGAYLLLLMSYWRNGGPLPDDDGELQSIARMSQEQWSASRKRIRKFFFPVIVDGEPCLGQKRAEKELANAKSLFEKKSNAGKQGNAKRWGKRTIADGSQCDAVATRKPDRITVADGIPQDIANASPNTPYPPSEAKASSGVASQAPPTTPKPDKGRRWGPDEQIPPNWLLEAEKARDEHKLPRINLVLESHLFANHWAAKSGKDATHTDWKRTWINWALKAYGAKPMNGESKSWEKVPESGKRKGVEAALAELAASKKTQ